MRLTYSQSGVNRSARAEAKKAISVFGKPAGVVKTPFNDLFPLGGGKAFYAHTTDGVGTKVLLTQLAGEHWVAGWDAIAMVVNDAIRCGAKPESVTDAIDIADSSGPEFGGILDGVSKACVESGCFVAGGETADVRELVNGFSKNPYHINASCFAVVEKEKMIVADGLREGDVVIGMKSSGLHSNGFSLVRKALFKQWGGAYDALEEPKGRALLKECVKPTRLYVKPFLALAAAVGVKAAVNVTGDAYGKLEKLQAFSRVGFELDRFAPQPVFAEIQAAGGVAREELFKTFNMGWGFAAIVSPSDESSALGVLKKNGVEAAVIGKVVKGTGITVVFEGVHLVLKA